MKETRPEHIMLKCSMLNFFLSIIIFYYSHEFQNILMDKLFTARHVC